MFNAAMFTFGHVAAACIAKAIALYRGSILATGDMVQDHLRWTQNGLIQVFDGPERQAWVHSAWGRPSLSTLRWIVFRHVLHSKVCHSNAPPDSV
jgi:hypothetical protein